MKYEDLPEFARPYKKKGYDVRKRKDTFFLYRITSRMYMIALNYRER